MGLTAMDLAHQVSRSVKEVVSPADIAEWLEPGCNAWFVGSAANWMNSSLQAVIRPTVKGCLPLCRSNKNDVIFVLPGHSETIDSAWSANLVAGTKIVGLGNPFEESACATFTWNATGSTLAVDVANVTLANLYMLSTANGVTEGIGVTGAGFKFLKNRVQLATAATDEFALFLDVEAAAHRALIQGNRMLGITAASRPVVVSGVANDVTIKENWIRGVTGAVGTGVIELAAAALRLRVEGNILSNSLALSTACISATNVAMEGTICHNLYHVLVDTRAATHGFVAAGTNPDLHHYENYVAGGGTTKGLSGILAPASA